MVGRNRPFVVKIFERAAETWESIREGGILLDEWMKALERRGIRDSSGMRSKRFGCKWGSELEGRGMTTIVGINVECACVLERDQKKEGGRRLDGRVNE